MNMNKENKRIREKKESTRRMGEKRKGGKTHPFFFFSSLSCLLFSYPLR